jgi:predicted TIM-barrel fold metal-dependent hydrolase
MPAIHARRCALDVIALGLLLALVTPGWAAKAAAEYRGRIIDAHAHLPARHAIDTYVEAMKRHNVAKVVLLGVGSAQRHDAAWIAAAARKHPSRVIPGLPLPHPTTQQAADQVAAGLAKRGARVVGEVHIRHVRRRIERDPSDGPFTRVLEVTGRRGVPVVIHDDLNARATGALESALAARPDATVILAHAGGAPPAVIDRLLGAHPNLLVDLSGMHFQRRPALATETGPIDPAWKAVIEKAPDRFLMGLDVSTPRLFEPAMLDRLMKWTRRILGELKPDVAERVAYRNAARLFHAE